MPIANYGKPYAPPAKYDHAYAGEVIVRRFADEVLAWKICTNKGQGYPNHVGCVLSYLPPVPPEPCTIWMVADRVMQMYGIRPADVLRHELGHCNGWPGDHPR